METHRNRKNMNYFNTSSLSLTNSNRSYIRSRKTRSVNWGWTIKKICTKRESVPVMCFLIGKFFRIFTTLVLCFQQIAWAMDDLSRTSASQTEFGSRERVPNPSTEDGSLEESLLAENTDEIVPPVPVIQFQTRQSIQEPIHNHIETTDILSHEDQNRFLLKRQLYRFDIQGGTSLDESTSIQKLLQIETSWWRGSLRWANIDSLLQRLGYSLALRNDAVTQITDQKRMCSYPVWLSGGAFPVESERTRKYILFIDGFRQGAEFIIFRII